MAFTAVGFVAALLPALAAAVNLRRAVDLQGQLAPLTAEAFPAAFVAEVDSAIDTVLLPGLAAKRHASLVSSGSHVHSNSNLTGLGALIAKGTNEVDINAALNMPNLPATVVQMLKKDKKKKGKIGYKADPALVEKAVVNLNDMVSEAQVRLDTKTVECSVFQIKTEKTLAQVNADLARLSQQLSNTERMISNSMAGIEASRLATQQTKEELEKEKVIYNDIHSADMAVLADRQADLDVATFILQFSKCKDLPMASAMLQGNRGSTALKMTSTGYKMCSNGNGTTGNSTVSFEDPEIEAAAKKLSPLGQKKLVRLMKTEQQFTTEELEADGGKVAASVEAEVFGSIAGLETEGDRDDGDDDAAGEDAESDGSKLALMSAKKHKKRELPVDLQKICGVCDGCMLDGACVAPKEGADLSKTCTAKGGTLCMQVEVEPAVTKPEKKELKAANKCSGVQPHCGVLHDLFAGLWGGMKDLVEEQQAKIDKDTSEWKLFQSNINTQLQAQATQLSELQSTLAEATSEKTADTEQQNAKNGEKAELTTLYDATMKECNAQMKEILFNEICGVLAVRNNMIKEEMVGQPVPTDCQFSEWIPGECSLPCDDELVGGMQELKREIITLNKDRGVKCPALETERKCNQIKCPIDCKLTEYSAWGKCTKECGSGVQTRTRSVSTKPLNGGQACDALLESQPCNTGACDFDCTLSDWTEFSRCSQTCNAGYNERRKRVLEPLGGTGTCAADLSKERLERKTCNTQACIGDEKCVAKMDLVIAVDASGSITQKGFEILKTFTEKIVERMSTNTHVAVVQFGNGELDSDHIVSDAKLISSLTDNTAKTVSAIKGMVWQKGFTNMAQGLFKAKEVLGNTPYTRNGADSAVLVITDGRPSFQFQTSAAVQKLRAGAKLSFAHVQRFRKEEMAALLKNYASDPWESNYIHIKGKNVLKTDYDHYVTEVLSELCGNLTSPSAVEAKLAAEEKAADAKADAKASLS